MKRRTVQPPPSPPVEIIASKTRCYDAPGGWVCPYSDNHASGATVCGLFRVRIDNGLRHESCKRAERAAIVGEP